MPSNGFPFTVRVRGQENTVGLFRFIAQDLDHVPLATNSDIMGFKIMLDIHAHIALRQIANMAHRWLDHIIFTQKALDRFGFGG